MQLPFLWLEASQIDFSDEVFRVRWRHPSSLRLSIERSGIRSPIVVEPLGANPCKRFRLVAGWGRWLARPAGALLPCFVLPSGASREAAWDVVLLDNDRWNVLEIARVLDRLGRIAGIDPEQIVREKLPLLGVHASSDLYRRHLRLLELGMEAQRFVEEEELPLRRAATLFKLPPDAIEVFLQLAKELGLTFNEVSESIELIEETASRDRVAPSTVIQEARARGPSKEAFLKELRSRRYPELSRHRDRLVSIEKELHFTSPARIEWDARLERPGIRLIADLADTEALAAFERDLTTNRTTLKKLL